MDIRIPLNMESDIIIARQKGRELAERLGFGVADQTRLATGISELTRNVINYAKKGLCVITDASDEQAMRVRVSVEDHGPGIPDIAAAMKDGFSTVRSLGMGLPGTRRLVHDFDISSKPGHTKVVISIFRPRPAVAVAGVKSAASRLWAPRK